jgi:hypothetical protein
MLNLAARTEMNDAWANLVLVDAFLRQCKYKEAEFAWRDAERHYQTARTTVTIQHSDSTLEKLGDLRLRLAQTRSVLRSKSEVFEAGSQRASAGGT